MEKNIKKIILDYLQLHSLDLNSQIPALNKFMFEDDPPRLVLCLARETKDIPEIEFMGEKIPVEVRITGEPIVMRKNDVGVPKPEKHPVVEDDGLFHHEIGDGEAISPFSKPQKNDDETRSAVEKWKKRWPTSKIYKNEE